MLNQIESSEIPASVSVRIGPTDSRCKYWAKIVRAGVALPSPDAADGARDIPGEFLRNGEDEIEPGDVLICGKEVHHRHHRGWHYWVVYMAADGTKEICRPGADEKAELKAQGMPPAMLRGSGGLAACVRVIHGLRAGMTVAGKSVAGPRS